MLFNYRILNKNDIFSNGQHFSEMRNSIYCSKVIVPLKVFFQDRNALSWLYLFYGNCRIILFLLALIPLRWVGASWSLILIHHHSRSLVYPLLHSPSLSRTTALIHEYPLHTYKIPDYVIHNDIIMAAFEDRFWVKIVIEFYDLTRSGTYDFCTPDNGIG